MYPNGINDFNFIQVLDWNKFLPYHSDIYDEDFTFSCQLFEDILVCIPFGFIYHARTFIPG